MGISIWQLLIVLVIVLLLFGTKKLRNLGSDLGGAVKGFRSAVKDGQLAVRRPRPRVGARREYRSGECLRPDRPPSPSRWL